MRPLIRLAIPALLAVLTVLPALPGTALAQDALVHDPIDMLWDRVQPPSLPGIGPVAVDPATTALLVLDMEELTCNAQRRPRCLATAPRIADLLRRARSAGLAVVHSQTPKRTPFLSDMRPGQDEPVVASSVDKFWRTDLEKILKDKGVTTVIVTGTAAHGAVLHTATAAGFRGLRIILPVDCLSAADLYTEQAAVQLLLTGPATRNAVTLTRGDMIEMP